MICTRNCCRRKGWTSPLAMRTTEVHRHSPRLPQSRRRLRTVPPGGALSTLKIPAEFMSCVCVIRPDTLVACISQRCFMLWVARDGWHGNARWLWQWRALEFSEAESVGLLVTAGCQVWPVTHPPMMRLRWAVRPTMDRCRYYVNLHSTNSFINPIK